MPTTIELDKDGQPTGNVSASSDSMLTSQVMWNTKTTLQSPFFWVVVGVGLAALGYWFVKKKMA